MRIDLAAVEATISGRITEVGSKSHGLVEWRAGELLTLDSENSALVSVSSPGPIETKPQAALPRVLWKVRWGGREGYGGGGCRAGGARRKQWEEAGAGR